jgi:hypothetical protein
MSAMAKKRSNADKGTIEPRWKTIEKVVALLEKSLTPEARVMHNVKLPCLTTGHEEQCDVVIETGRSPRVSRTIVEVQKRNERVKPNEFRGWCQKLRDVGANRLICVSAKPFPKSIKDKVAKELGPTVLLVRLEALESNRWPFQIVNGAMKVYKPKVSVDNSIMPNPLLTFDPLNNPFREFNGVLMSGAEMPNVIQREGTENLLPLMDLINEGVRSMNDRPELLRLPEGAHPVVICWNPINVNFCLNGQSAPIIEVRIAYTLEIISLWFPFEISSYTQDGHNTLAWIVRATGDIDGENAEIRFVCTPATDGCFTMSHPQLFGINEGVYLFWGYADQLPFNEGESLSDASLN